MTNGLKNEPSKPIGTPSEVELEFLNESAKIYIRQVPRHARQSFTEKFFELDPLAIDLIEKMLKFESFDPRRRITACNYFRRTVVRVMVLLFWLLKKQHRVLLDMLLFFRDNDQLNLYISKI